MIISELGYSISLWNRDEYGVSATSSIHCGSYKKGVQNSVWLEFQSLDPKLKFDTISMLRTLKAMIEIWAPSLAVITRDSSAPTPYGLPNDQSVLQLAYYETSDNEGHPIWRPSGDMSENICSGKLWIDNSVVRFFET
jgi:hypothetical protein